MSLQWTLVAGVLYCEMALIVLLLLPFISNKAWQKFFKSRFLQVLSKQASWYFAIILSMLALLFLDAIREMRKYSTEHLEKQHAHLESELQHSMKLFRAQRNFYISGFSLFLSPVIYCIGNMISKTARLEAENEAAIKQARSATAAADTLLKQGSGEDAQNSSNEAHQIELNKLAEEITAQKKEIASLKKDKEAVVSQAKSLEKEYDRLTEEHRKLQLKLNVQGDSKKDE